MVRKQISFIVFFVIITCGALHAQTWYTKGPAGFSAAQVEYSSIAVNGTGTPYVVYEDYGNGQKATVMKYSGSTFSWVLVGIAGFSAGQAENTSIAIDPAGTPYVAYSDVASGYAVTVMKFNGSSWVAVGSPGFSAGGAYYVHIAIDGSGTPYVVYDDASIGSGPATVMKYNGSSWETVGIAGFSAGGARDLSIAMDPGGLPYVAFQDNSVSNKATVMKYNGSSWTPVGTVGFSASNATYTAIAIDGSGVPYVVYSDGGTGKATVMKYNGSSWVNVGSALFSAGEAGFTNIAIDGSGIPYVVYKDFSAGDKATVMKFNGAGWVNAGNSGFSAGLAAYTAIAIDPIGVPYVVFEDAVNGNAVTVMELGPTAIEGTDSLCTGFTTSLSDTSAGGTWSSPGFAGIVSVGSTTGIVTGIAPGTAIISYTVAGISATYTVTVGACPALEVNSIGNPGFATLSVFPNPNEGSFTINLSSPSTEPLQIVITNLVGQKIKEITAFTNQDVELAMDGPPGIYLLTVISKNERVVAKLVIE